MKETEDLAAKLTERFLDVHSMGGFAVNILMIAVIPAIGKRCCFAGCSSVCLANGLRISILPSYWRLSV